MTAFAKRRIVIVVVRPSFLLSVTLLICVESSIQSESADFAPDAAKWRTGRNVRVVFDFCQFYPLCENIWRHPQNRKYITCRTAARRGPSHGPRVTCAENLVKFGRACRFWDTQADRQADKQTSKQTNRQTDKQTDKQTSIQTHWLQYFASLRGRRLVGI